MGNLLRDAKLSEEFEKKIHMIGRGSKIVLDNHYRDWATGLPFTAIMSKHAKISNKMGLSLDELVEILIEEKYIKISRTPGGLRMVFSGECKLSNDEMLEEVRQFMFQEEAKREQKRLERRGP